MRGSCYCTLTRLPVAARKNDASLRFCFVFSESFNRSVRRRGLRVTVRRRRRTTGLRRRLATGLRRRTFFALRG
jgi:hypothetical protein